MRRSFVAGFMAVLLLAGACGGDDSGAPAATGPASAQGAEGAQAASGEPLRIGTTTSPQNIPATTGGAEAAIAAINAAGGIKGRPIELVACDNENDPNKAAECARQLAGDESVVATVGIIAVYGGDTNPIFEAADLAGIGTATAGSGDFASPIVFPASASAVGTALGSSAALYDKLDSTEQALVLVDTPAGVAFTGLVNDNVLGPRGTRAAATTVIPLTAADVTPQAAAIGDTDGALIALTPDLAIRFVQAARQQGYKEPMVVAASQLSASRVEESLSGFTDELYATGTFDFDSAGWARMENEAKANGADLALLNDTFANAWLSVQIFAHVASEVDSIDRPSILAAMNELSDFDTEGMTADPLDFTVTGEMFAGNAPRIIPSIQYVFLYRYEDGVYVPYDDKPQPLTSE